VVANKYEGKNGKKTRKEGIYTDKESKQIVEEFIHTYHE